MQKNYEMKVLLLPVSQMLKPKLSEVKLPKAIQDNRGKDGFESMDVWWQRPWSHHCTVSQRPLCEMIKYITVISHFTDPSPGSWTSRWFYIVKYKVVNN